LTEVKGVVIGCHVIPSVVINGVAPPEITARKLVADTEPVPRPAIANPCVKILEPVRPIHVAPSGEYAKEFVIGTPVIAQFEEAYATPCTLDKIVDTFLFDQFMPSGEVAICAPPPASH
jgi:hypothetical protein